MTSVYFVEWVRLEPVTSDPSLAPGTEAEIADPLWLLGRQWQIGEYGGEDAGSPALVEVHGHTARFTHVSLGAPGAPWRRYDVDTQPLEVIIEAEPKPVAGADLRRSAQAGIRLVQELRDRRVARATVDAFREGFPMPALDDATRSRCAPATVRRLELLSAAAPDGVNAGRALRDAMGAAPPRTGDMPPEVQHVNATNAVIAACHAFLDWLESVTDLRRVAPRPTTPSAWQADRLETTFAVASRATDGGAAVLRAPGYRGGRLDWPAFDAATGEAGPAAALPERQRIDRTVLPTPLSFRGAPVARYWTMEDAAVDLSNATAAPHELASLLLLGFAFSYGHDFLMVPLELPVGTRTEIAGVVVQDVFGRRTLIDPAGVVRRNGAAPIRLFSPTGADGSFVLAPSLGSTLDGPPVEELWLLRDEMANLGWAVEALAADAAGIPVRAASLLPPPDPDTPPDLPPAIVADAPPPDDRPALGYRLATGAPAAWFPLVPQARGDRLAFFRVGVLPAEAGSDPPTPRGALLSELIDEPLDERELAREGRRLRRVPQLARWIDGSTHAWVGRDIGPGRGEGSSGLRFDSILPSE